MHLLIFVLGIHPQYIIDEFERMKLRTD